MYILKQESAPRYIRPGISGHLLASPRTCGAGRLAISLVDIEPGGEQSVHSHDPEQVYYVIEGRGCMTVADEISDVAAGDCVFVPSGIPHGLKNTGESKLRYLGIVAPSFTEDELYQFWPDPSISKEHR